MKFACEQCQTKYNFPDERVRGKILKIRCKKCAALITVSESGARTAKGEPGPQKAGGNADSLGDTDGNEGGDSTMIGGMADFFGKSLAAASEPDEWHVSIDGAMNGPQPLAEVASRIAAEDAPGREIFVWREGFTDWLPPDAVDDVKKAVDKARREGPKNAAIAARAQAASLASDEGGDATQIGSLNLDVHLRTTATEPEEYSAPIEAIDTVEMVSDVPAPPKPKAPPPKAPPPAFKPATPSRPGGTGKSDLGFSPPSAAPARSAPSTPGFSPPAAERALPPPAEPLHIPESEPTGNLADLIRAKGLDPGKDPLVALGLKKDEIQLPGIDGVPSTPPPDIGIFHTLAEEEKKPKSKAPMFAGLAGLVLVVGVGAFLALSSGGKPKDKVTSPADAGPPVVAKAPETVAAPKPPKKDEAGALVGLTEDEFKELLDKGEKALSSCYAKALKKDESLKGTKLSIEASVSEKGKTTDVTLSGTDAEGKLGKCVTKAVKKWKYGKGQERQVKFGLTVTES